MVTAFSHLGICVTDLERATRFYCEGLGFTVAESHRVGGEFDRLMELEGVELRSQFVRRDAIALELLAFSSPEVVGDGERRGMNRIGLTHLSVRVDDIDATSALVESLGGSVVAGTRTTLELGEATLDFVYCTDPDGVRIELMCLPA
jgi:catechol 2,3-dioxygenase-like lactoylglutathione lyase family enzyme